MYKLFFLITMSILFFPSCSSIKEQQNSSSNKEVSQFLETRISPDYCRIKGKIKSVTGQDASVIVDSVLGFGSGFKVPITAGKVISLSVTNDSKLSVGILFYSDMKEIKEIGNNSSIKFSTYNFISLSNQ